MQVSGGRHGKAGAPVRPEEREQGEGRLDHSEEG